MAAKKNGLIVALIAILVVAAAGAGGWWWMNRDAGAGGPADANLTADQPLTAALPPSPDAVEPASAPAAPANQFTMAAVIDEAGGFANVHSGPSTVAPIVARVGPGEVFSTYEQGSDWWRVRTEGGLIGYMPRVRIQMRGEAPRMAAAPSSTTVVPGTPVDMSGNPTAQGQVAQAPKAAPRPRRRPRSRINRANSENMRLFCQNAGRGTPQCRQFRRDLGGR